MVDTPAPRRSDALARRERIIDTAITLFRDTGQQVPLETIADTAGVGIATLYRNFADRAQLQRACALRMGEDILTFQRAALESMETDPVGAWRTYVSTLANLGVGLFISSFAPVDLSHFDDELTHMCDLVVDQGNDIIEAARTHGLVGSNIDHVMFFLGLVIVTRPPGSGITAILPDISDNVLEIFLEGLRHPLPDLNTSGT